MGASPQKGQSHTRSAASLDAVIRDLQQSADVLKGRIAAEAARDMASGAQPAFSAAQVRAIILARRLRHHYLELESGDPAWTLLLELLAARLEGRWLAITDLALAAGLSPKTSLRWLGALQERGLVSRRPSPKKSSSVLVDLTDEGADRMRAYLTAALAASPWIS